MPRLALALALLLVALGLPRARPAEAAPRCFPGVPGVSDCIDGAIGAFWQAQGGLPVFGYPLGPARQEGTVTSQPFERARLEHHPENAPPYDILLGRLGADALAARGEPPAAPEIPRPGCRHFAETGLNVCGAFLQAYGRYGLDLGRTGVAPEESLALFGLPLTAPREERLSDGRAYLVQWFERARFEDHGPAGVLFGLLGSEAGGAAAPPAPAQGLEPGGFVQARGDQLVRLGRPVQLKGVNYYPQGRPWAEMWQQWDGPQIERELRLARDQLGVNAVRVLLPYDLSRDQRSNGLLDGRALDRLRQLAEIAGDLDMRLIVALFDFYEEFPLPGTRAEAENLAYLRTLLGNFAGDDRIIAWDLHNEPDHYELWARRGQAQQVLGWLGRMADEVHRIAPNHMVTVGMGQYENLYQPGPDGRRVVDYSDLVSVHIYNAADAARQLDELRRHTDKPILLGEFGWPTGPECAVRGYGEADQEQVYRATLEAARGRVAGVLAWTLRDYDAGPTYRWETREEHYGLVRPDGSLKPAAAHLRAWPGEPLPSATRLDTRLTVEGVFAPGGPRAPVRVGETGRHVKGEFRNAYEVYNGRFSFGPPISEAFERAEGRRVVQFYTGAVLAYYPEVRQVPGWTELLGDEQLRRLIRPLNIGEQYLAARGVPPQPSGVDGEFERLYRALGGRWRFGAAISPKLSEEQGGATVRVQYFQHGSLQTNPATGVVEPGPLGAWAWEQQCASVR
ncbi:MAG TPA: cellulase family glycosylhydrolase [Chloroflexaceae bacterium]|nr:cellulase family glycosylhydrolase [Chloroflexaceae bacterium]